MWKYPEEKGRDCFIASEYGTWAGESSGSASLRVGGRQRKEGWDYVGESLLIPEHLTSVEVLWFHQPRLRSVRPGAPSHILWYVLVAPTQALAAPRQP